MDNEPLLKITVYNLDIQVEGVLEQHLLRHNVETIHQVYVSVLFDLDPYEDYPYRLLLSSFLMG